ncbi:MAG: hypothetical protein HZA32_14625 [Opitutae bacterium]|nr:hypothetical protein [Opitutae bacterium]
MSTGSTATKIRTECGNDSIAAQLRSARTSAASSSTPPPRTTVPSANRTSRPLALTLGNGNATSANLTVEAPLTRGACFARCSQWQNVV